MARMKGPKAKTDPYQSDVRQHAPERPREAWACEECGQRIPAGVFFCQHNAPPEIERLEIEPAFSSDMRPRIRRS